MQRRRGYAIIRWGDVDQWLPAVTAIVVDDDIVAASFRQTDEVAADMTMTTTVIGTTAVGPRRVRR